MEVRDGYTLYAATREWMKRMSDGEGIIIKEWIRCEDVMGKMEDVCFLKFGKSDNKSEWLVENLL